MKKSLTDTFVFNFGLFILIAFLFIWGLIAIIPNPNGGPDTRTIQEIKEDRYKSCLENNNALAAEACKNFLK